MSVTQPTSPTNEDIPIEEMRERKPRIPKLPKMSPQLRNTRNMMLAREASGLTMFLLLLMFQWLMPLHVTGFIDAVMLTKVIILALIGGVGIVWYPWAQLNAVYRSTDDDAEVDDSQANRDTGYSYLPLVAYGLMILVSGFGWVLDTMGTFRGGEWWMPIVRDRMIMSWFMVAYAPFIFVVVWFIDLKRCGPIYQRINNLRGRLVRLERPQRNVDQE